jgi:hypothetical protein
MAYGKNSTALRIREGRAVLRCMLNRALQASMRLIGLA